MVNKNDIITLMNLVSEVISQPREKKIYLVVNDIYALGKVARSLHKRYENQCSYEWATTKEYEQKTKRLQEKANLLALRLNVKIEHQTDPRGLPLIIKTGFYETRL